MGVVRNKHTIRPVDPPRTLPALDEPRDFPVEFAAVGFGVEPSALLVLLVLTYQCLAQLAKVCSKIWPIRVPLLHAAMRSLPGLHRCQRPRPGLVGGGVGAEIDADDPRHVHVRDQGKTALGVVDLELPPLVVLIGTG